MALMPYETQMFLDSFHSDGLLITAKGLGMERIFSNFLKLYTEAENLVLVINTTQQEEEYFMEKLQQSGTKPMPKVITTEYSANDRYSIYMSGGVLFVTSRILVVDMLTDKIPINLITGILVYRAHRIVDSCQEAFILRLYRQKNKVGFIKAFSVSPVAFTAGFCHVERVMRSLFVKHLFLWPRFHAEVISCFDQQKVDVVELHLPLTASMLGCQTALLALIDACVKELRRTNPGMDTDEVTVETAISRDFDKVVRAYMDPVWHQLSTKTKQLVSDIKTLRLLLECLTQYDCVNFYNLVNSVRTSEKTFGSNSGWLFLDAADSLFMHAKDRVYGRPDTIKKAKQDTSGKKTDKAPRPPALEECPKWAALREVLTEIDGYNKTAAAEKADAPGTDAGTAGGSDGEGSEGVRSNADQGRVLVAALDDRTCNQLREFLCDGGQPLLRRLFDKTVAMKAGLPRQPEGGPRGRGRGATRPGQGGAGKSADGPTLTQIMAQAEIKGDKDTAEPAGCRGDGYYGVLQAPVTVLHPLFGSSDPFSLVRTLEELQPRYVVLYDAQMSFVRQLEVYRASHPGRPLRVYFLMYADSTEEQRYLTTLRREKEAFEYLIREKATMVVPEDREGRLDDDPRFARGGTPANATVNTRKGGHQAATNVQHKVIVDMREFRSELPSLIHRRGIDIEPITIEVGDYILTPDICVERKSVSDLIGSLNNGRLYNQCVSMCRYYMRPVLLIEFDPNKPFTLQPKSAPAPTDSSRDTVSKLALLTLCFPRLRVFWCQSPYATAELFEEVKTGRAQPDAAAAAAITTETEKEVAAGKYSHGPQEVLLKMPGVTSKNIYLLMNAVTDLRELVSLPEARLGVVLGSLAHARALYGFLHASQQTMEGALPAGHKGNKYGNKAPKWKK